MPFRDKFKKALGINNSGDDDTPQTKAPKPPTENPFTVGRRKPMDKLQKQKMENFSFDSDSTERRKSIASQYSPMASKRPSRHNSSDNNVGSGEKPKHGHHLGVPSYGRELKREETIESTGTANAQASNPADPVLHGVDPELEGQPNTERDMQGAGANDHRPLNESELKAALNKAAAEVPANAIYGKQLPSTGRPKSGKERYIA